MTSTSGEEPTFFISSRSVKAAASRLLSPARYTITVHCFSLDGFMSELLSADARRVESRLDQSGEEREDRESDRAVDRVVTRDVSRRAADADGPDTECDRGDHDLQRLCHSRGKPQVENGRQQSEGEQPPAEAGRALLRANQSVDGKVKRHDLRRDVFQDPV